ncbi:MAG: ABC transporter permease [Methanobacteriaceae archaeon]
MNEIVAGFLQAVELIMTLDPEVIAITLLTLQISILSTFFALLIGIPIGVGIHFKEFRGKKTLVTIVQTLYSIPTVLVGLLVFLLISNSGPLGSFNLLFTPQGMIMGQVILILPIAIGLTISALQGVKKDIKDLAISLGTNRYQLVITVIKEAKYALFTAIILGFGRAISEVGVAMMIGGNIRGFTRVITTTMSLETSKGNISISIALGIILLVIALVVNILLNYFQEK